MGPLQTAAAMGYDGIVADVLLMKKTRIDAADRLGRTALAHAASNGRLAVVRLLVHAGANVNCRHADRRTPVMLAAMEDRHAVIDLLVESCPGLQLEAIDIGGRTALIWACLKGNAAAAEALLVARCRANTRDAQGKTALMAAADGGFAAVASLLILSRADLDVTDAHGSTALMLAAAQGQLEIVELLLGQGAEYLNRDDDGRTALMQAACNGHVAVCSALMSHCVHRMGFAPTVKLTAPRLEVGKRLAEPEPLDAVIQSRVDDALAKVKRVSMSGAVPATAAAVNYHRTSSSGRAVVSPPQPVVPVQASQVHSKAIRSMSISGL